MSGHSKWAKIKRQKGANDAKRGSLFTKLARDITVAASEGGGDPDMNFTLRLAMEKAKEANMPKDNIERAVKKGTGELEGGRLERVSYEAYAQGGAALIIDCTTDNTNRTVSDIKRTLDVKGAKFAEQGSVQWQFEEKGLIIVSPERLQEKLDPNKFSQDKSYEKVESEEVLLELMDIDGVADVKEESGVIEVFTSKNDFSGVHEAIEKTRLKIESAELIKVPKDGIETDPDTSKQIEELVDLLEDHDDVDNVWSNVK